MVEKIGTIKNPLTIIAIFAAIAEISGTVVLPFIATANQATYVWFLITFPILLILLFFITLNFNHRVLYAPSDYQNEDNFLRSLPRATYEERAMKIETEVASIGTTFGTSGEPTGGTAGASEPSVTESDHGAEGVRQAWSSRVIFSRDIRTTYVLAEELVFQKLRSEFQSEIQREVRVGGPNRTLILDGIVRENGVTTIIEVKLWRPGGSVQRIREALLRLAAGLALPIFADGARLMLVVVTTGDVDRDRIVAKLNSFEFSQDLRLHVPLDIRIYKLEELEREFGPTLLSNP